MEIKQLTNTEFKNFTNNFKPSSMYQSNEYAFTMNEEKFDTFFLGLIDNNQILGASLILVQKVNGFKYAYAPRGFLLNYNDSKILETFTTLIKKFLGKLDIVAIKISPLLIKKIYNADLKLIGINSNYDTIFNNLKKLGYYHLGYNNYFEALKPRFEAIIDIDDSIENLFNNVKKNFRKKIRKAERDGIKVYHGSEKDLEYLYLQTKNKYPRNLEYFKDIYHFFDKDNLVDFYYSKLDTTQYLKVSQALYNKSEKLAKEINLQLIGKNRNNVKKINQKIKTDEMLEEAKKQMVIATKYLKDYPDGIILSSVLIIKWQEEVYLLIDGYDSNYKNFNAKHLLLWKLIARYNKLGYKRFNLGGISNIHKTSNWYKGLNEFKLSFNAKAIEYAGDFELITNSPRYFMYQKATNFNNMIKK